MQEGQKYTYSIPAQIFSVIANNFSDNDEHKGKEVFEAYVLIIGRIIHHLAVRFRSVSVN